MSKSSQEHLGRRSRSRAVLLGGLVVLCLSSVWAAGTARVADQQKRKADLEAQLRAAAFRAASKGATIGFPASLEMKENTDFLLTPALLVQQALSEDVIITYPSE